MMLKAGLAGVDGAVAAVGAGEGLGRDLMTAFGAGFKHDKCFLSIEIETNKKCAAEAAHEKCMAPCCDTIVFYFDNEVYENRAYIFTVVKMYTIRCKSIQLCRTIIIAQVNRFVKHVRIIFEKSLREAFKFGCNYSAGFQIWICRAPAVRELGVAEFNRVLPVGKTQRSP